MKKGVQKTLTTFWRSFGGWKELFKSPGFWYSMIFNIILFPNWTKGGWWDLPITIFPSILGFSLGGYAIFLSFGDKEFFHFLSEPDDSTHSPQGIPDFFLGLNSSFVFFILLQTLSLLYAIIAKSYDTLMTDWLTASSIPISRECFIDLPLTRFIIIIQQLKGTSVLTFWFLGHYLFIYALISNIILALNLFEFASWYRKFLLTSTSIKNKE